MYNSIRGAGITAGIRSGDATTPRHACKDYGLGAAQVFLGHKSPPITQVYAEIDAAKTVEIMAKVG